MNRHNCYKANISSKFKVEGPVKPTLLIYLQPMSNLSPIKIMLVEDDPWLRLSFRPLLESVSRLKIVAEASGAEEALQHLRSNPDIHMAIVDIHLDGATNGIQLTEQICSQFPRVIVLILSNQDKEEYIREAEQAGAHGYLWKETPWLRIVSIIEFIVDNPLGGFIRLESEAVPPPPYEKLTPREGEVLWLMGDGLSSKKIARVLKKKSEPQEEISVRTV